MEVVKYLYKKSSEHNNVHSVSYLQNLTDQIGKSNVTL